MGFLTGNPAVRQLANEGRTRALMHVTIGTTKASEIETLLEAVEVMVNEPWFSRFKVVEVTPDTRTHVTNDLARRVARLLRTARFERKLVDIKGALSVPVKRPDSIPLVSKIRQHLMSAEALVPVTLDQAESIAEAVVALGPDASVESIVAAVASVM